MVGWRGVLVGKTVQQLLSCARSVFHCCSAPLRGGCTAPSPPICVLTDTSGASQAQTDRHSQEFRSSGVQEHLSLLILSARLTTLTVIKEGNAMKKCFSNFHV